MSDKHTDDRDIDEVLASIDEMLAEKQLYSYKPSAKQGLLVQKIKATTAELKASSQTNTPDASATKASKVKEKQKPPKILLGKGDYADDDKADTTKQPTTKNAPSKAHEKPYKIEPLAGFSDHPLESDDVATKPASKDTPKPNKVDDKPKATTKDFISTPRHRVVLTEALLAPSAQEALPLWVEGDQPNFQETNDQTESQLDESEATHHNKKIYTQSIEQTELVEAIVTDALHPSTDANRDDNEMAPIINKYEVEQLVRMISEDVATQLQQHIQNILPKLVKKTLQQHFASTRKDTE